MQRADNTQEEKSGMEDYFDESKTAAGKFSSFKHSEARESSPQCAGCYDHSGSSCIRNHCLRSCSHMAGKLLPIVKAERIWTEKTRWIR